MLPIEINKDIIIIVFIIIIIIIIMLILHYSDWVCTAVMSNDVMKDLRG